MDEETCGVSFILHCVGKNRARGETEWRREKGEFPPLEKAMALSLCSAITGAMLLLCLLWEDPFGVKRGGGEQQQHIQLPLLSLSLYGIISIILPLFLSLSLQRRAISFRGGEKKAGRKSE